MSFWGKVISVW